MILPLAYMNPGTGSLLLQMLLMGTAGFFVGFRSFWSAIKSMWKKKK